jgi:hypothetical protein
MPLGVFGLGTSISTVQPSRALRGSGPIALPFASAGEQLLHYGEVCRHSGPPITPGLSGLASWPGLCPPRIRWIPP